MKILIIIGFLVNSIILLIYHMHMFQLNSYFFKKHMRWMKANTKKIVTQIIAIALPTLLLCFNNAFCNIICILLLGWNIFNNYPKGKAKTPFNVTHRVKRMFFTEAILILLTLILTYKSSYILVVLGLLNILSIVFCMIANFINYPFEFLSRKHYVDEAKKIINDMPNLLVIGVTGSYGKTSVKNYLVKTLSAKYEVLTTPKNYNTTLGVAKTIRENLKPTHQIFVCEMGATKLGDIKEICDIVNPKIGIITAIGPQHLESFKSIENIIKTKFELMDSVNKNGGVTFLNCSNEYLAKQKVEGNVFKYGIRNNMLDYNSYNLSSSSQGLSFTMFDKKFNKEVEFKTKLIGKHNAVNLTAAVAVSNYLDIPLDSLVSRVREIKNVEHRLQLINHGDLTIIDDSYNSNPVSSKSALDTLADFSGTKIIVTPGLIELGNDSKKYNFELGKYIANVCDYAVLVNSEPAKSILEGIKSTDFDTHKIFNVATPQEAMQKISSLNITGKITVLLENDLPDNYNV